MHNLIRTVPFGSIWKRNDSIYFISDRFNFLTKFKLINLKTNNILIVCKTVLLNKFKEMGYINLKCSKCI